MARFKSVPQSFIFNKTLTFWGNVVKNFNKDIVDDDFFEVLRRCFDHDKAIELVEAAYTPVELGNMSKSRLNLSASLDSVFQTLWNDEKGRSKCRELLLVMKDYVIEMNGRAQNETIERRFHEMKRALRLSDLELDVLLVAYVCSQTHFSWPTRVEDRDKPLYYAMALDRSYGEVLRVMNATGNLRKFYLLDSDWDFNARAIGGYIDGTEVDAIERRFYKRGDSSEVLPWGYFGSLSKRDGAILKRLLASKPGKCNILLYGAPGTGKTSFARSLAREVGRQALEINQGNDGKDMKPESRMMGIQLCNRQENPDESLMIVDEADELLRGNTSPFGIILGSGRGGKSTEKGVMNVLLDEMRMPAVWISNTSAEEVDESVRRRFDYSICFEALNNVQRVSIWQNLVGKHGLGLLISEEQIADYAARYATSAGGISMVLDNVKRMRPRREMVDEVIAALMKPHCKLMQIKEANALLPAKGYSLEGLNIKGKVPLEKIVGAVKNYMDESFKAASEDKPRMNLLLFGPPGAGKTEFVKFLGKELDSKVFVLKGSDILSKWVGESEQNIAKAFRRAEQEHAVLFFDEVDGLVQSRESAHASWEIAQVNELLQQMENFDGVMIAATNLCQNLDPAIMRRFTFKLEFDYLDNTGKKLFFERMFRTVLTDQECAELSEIQNLTPGDFRTVRQACFYLNEEQSNINRIAALQDECAIKKDGKRMARIGFAA